MANSDTIKSVVQGLQNENPDYSTQVNSALLALSSGLTNLSQTACGTTVKKFVQGNPTQNILKWSDVKPLLTGVPAVGDAYAVIGVISALSTAGGNVTALKALVQQYPSGDGEVYSDQLKPILTEIANILAGLGQ